MGYFCAPGGIDIPSFAYFHVSLVPTQKIVCRMVRYSMANSQMFLETAQRKLRSRSCSAGTDCALELAMEILEMRFSLSREDDDGAVISSTSKKLVCLLCMLHHFVFAGKYTRAANFQTWVTSSGIVNGRHMTL